MDILSIFGIAVALAMDAFAVALAAGATLRPLTFRRCFRLVFHFGLFQAMMPVIGWLAGLTVQSFVAAWSHWLAFLLLTIIGGRMIFLAVSAEQEHNKNTADPSKGLTLVALSIATSIDALAVGLTLAMLEVEIWLPALIIGLVAGGFTLTGLFLGSRAGTLWGKQIEVAGGVLLILIGCKILLTALWNDGTTVVSLLTGLS
ncbi:manganese efflux pump MntP [Desulfobulbus alkaliphilus]|uniref:manganese efflux pump MntP n=1 Tax=Desulfobulbus alkaliphilus TaxID=869814 RepID=UPI0019634BBF|nr:manganese efflux pump MntP family protein [Desulfobulbus alkaliphilus]MBM9537700.1 manganese efflux pump [Desulfobulbus alkaliphilus]